MIIYIAALLFFLRFTSAIPFYQLARRLPRDITHIAHDEERGVYHTFRSDDSRGGTYDDDDSDDDEPSDKKDKPACPPVTLEELKTLGSWSKVEAFANKRWGSTQRTLSIKPAKDKFVQHVPKICVDPESAPVDMGNKQCSVSRLDLKGGLEGTNGTLRMNIKQGYSNTAVWSVSKAITFAVGLSFEVRLKVPAVSEVGVETSFRTEIENEKTSTYETRMDNTVTQEVRIAVVGGKNCSGWIDTKSCNVNAKARIRFAVEGWVWFNYVHKQNGHFKWAVPLQNALSLDERSDWMETTGDMKTSTTANYGGSCK